MHPRAKATSPTGTPGPGHSNAFYGLSKLPFASPQTLQNSPNPPNAPNPPKPAKPSKHRPQQAPQIHSNDFLDAFKAALTGGQGHSNDFLWASKLQFASLQRIQTSKIPNTFPNMHPRAKATSPTGTPGPGHSNGFLWAFKAGFLRLSKLPFASPQTLQNSPNPPNPPNAPNPPKPAKPSKHRPQQAPQIHSNDSAMTFYGPQSCSLPACKGSKLPKFQTPSPTCTLGPRPLPQQAPQGQATAMAFYGLSKLAFLGFQSCRLPARKPSKTLQTLQALQTLQNPPNPPNTVPSRHLRSTAMTFLMLSKLPLASPQRLQPL